ncbi:MAG: hypothetical protein ACTSRP_15835 [Candidatus Helarchaeota archaeon]
MPYFPKYCNPLCQYLRCQQKAKGRIIRRGNKKFVECKYVEGEFCTGQNCNFAYCVKRSFRSDKKCGQWVALQSKDKDYEEDEDEDQDYDDMKKDNYNKYGSTKNIKKKYTRIRSKALKKIKYEDYDDF